MARAGEVRIVYEPDFRRRIEELGEHPLSTAASIVANGMRRRIPRSTDGSHGRPAGYAASRIQVWRGRDAEGSYRDAGTDATSPDGVSYPAILEHGSKPHIIESTGPWPLRSASGQVFGRKVLHPGTRPMPWARPSLDDLRGLRL